ncbi:PREDICTED: probable N-acetyltransferase HLS1-like [Camelina sativa]|uniref:Probable N-acetyltransferase HLS1-like n=1 Tax=Camelina sativa TaxID=90675 RepID=A0ABM0TQV3_CAMSA|nr:PREDICTED: probable N-acetyltransferase HLS1-like [Camelina sativa]
MSSKVATSAAVAAAVVVREYNEESDKCNVEEMERKCDETGNHHGKPVMVSDLLGDPVRRVRHFPSHTMLVAEYGDGRKMVGVVRGCVKTVTRGSNSTFVKLAYVLGLRVSPSHRNLGIGTKLVRALEEWFKQQGATYAYMATDYTNEPSINLFTKKCSYVKFRTPTMLVQPVHAHTKPIGSDITILRLTPETAESIYTRIFKDSEFFPRDIDAILTSRNSLGTFIAVPKEKHVTKSNREANFAILSVWSTKDVFRLQMKGVSRLTHAVCSGLRFIDSCMPWMKLPSFPNVFDKFWVYFMYGMHMEGKDGPRLMRSLCSFVHNIGRYDGGCGALAAELSPSDAVALAVPHWKRLSWAQDLWCLKKLSGEPEPSDWTRSTSSSSSSVIFVDPRDI